jgi:hypothetical protein
VSLDFGNPPKRRSRVAVTSAETLPPLVESPCSARRARTGLRIDDIERDRLL